jgi:hypothetical protein
MQHAIAVSVLGSDSDVFYAPPALFMRSASALGGEPIFSPPPFAAPCTDGLLIIYTLRRSGLLGEQDVHGGYIFFRASELEADMRGEPAAILWSRAKKLVDCSMMLRAMGFEETRPWMLN